MVTGLLVIITDFYTSKSYNPVQKIAQVVKVVCDQYYCWVSSRNGIDSLASSGNYFGYYCQLFICGSLWNCDCSNEYAINGGNSCAIDAYGPITDNAGGIAEMAGLDENVRVVMMN
jgi:K(+)-stimulated pyrophosphate-energized sodium pump